jgi:hypothetical protein
VDRHRHGRRLRRCPSEPDADRGGAIDRPAVEVIGDAVQPRSGLEAIAEGYRVARLIGGAVPTAMGQTVAR